ncbi:MAG: diaminopimelate decarboxylase family protein [Candidatus Limnocylindrales bacterium]
MSLVREPEPTPAAGAPPARNEVLRDGRLAGLTPEDLAQRFGTPAFVYDLDVVSRQVEELRSALPARFDLAYAVKANPNLAVLRHIVGLGLGADVASGGELRHVIRAGFDPAHIVMTGPGKRDEELAAAVEAGVRVVTVESLGELRRLAGIAEGLGRVQPILLRANATGAASMERVRIIGDEGVGKFGMGAPDLRIAAGEAVASLWLEPIGLHAFGASNVTDAAALAAHVEATVEAAGALAGEAGFELLLVDAGGGLGIPYAEHEAGMDLVDLGRRLVALSDRMADREATRGTRLLLEPGRFLVGSSGAYLTRVLECKQVGRGHVVIVDGGIHHVLRPSLVGQEHRVRVVTGAAAEPDAVPDRLPVSIAGPLCTGLDFFAREAVLALPAPGDLVAVLDLGAYGATESMPLFLSHPLPPEVAVRGGEAWVARPRVDPDVWLGWQAGEPGGA